MPRYKKIDRGMKLLPIDLSVQLLPATFEHALSHLIDSELDLRVFEARFRNDDTGAPAYPPSVMLKVILYAGLPVTLIAHLAAFLQRLVGEGAKQHQLELQFMATRRADRREISVLTLGRRILDASARHLKQLLPWQAIPPLTQEAIRAYDVAI
jgi:hypothetical protein